MCALKGKHVPSILSYTEIEAFSLPWPGSMTLLALLILSFRNAKPLAVIFNIEPYLRPLAFALSKVGSIAEYLMGILSYMTYICLLGAPLADE